MTINNKHITCDANILHYQKCIQGVIKNVLFDKKTNLGTYNGYRKIESSLPPPSICQKKDNIEVLVDTQF